MNRKCSTLLSIGISAGLVAFGVWFLYNRHAGFGSGYNHWIMPHHMTAFTNGMGIITVLFWILISAAAVLVISGIVSGRNDSSNRDEDAMAILKRRYAEGKIDKAHYEEMKRDLQPHNYQGSH